ncbi:serine/threonine-protein kinase [Microbispora hainanensis]|uniref:non-specific serine/threonine protein kinase n=1 Tax=Microbispora hainanensis TaxID=568844 RepID=A0A544Z326_9ACTN|nr:serine/threonine-protein kinase [Microbispora hainanensis]TQS23446.1 serine/threonine protein kinase [Microbispora hainanensis]
MAEAQTSERVVAGRYRLIEPLGRGGMGTVWRAVDQVLEREVAVKELLASAGLTGAEREVFTIRTFREARAAGRLSHPGVAAVYNAFEENGYPWIVLELIPSRTLGSVIHEEGPLPPRRVAEIGSQVLAALRVAHANGVLHRDVKPDNVLLADDGRVVLTDFGIAAMEDDSPVTRTGMLIGTPAFIAPERAAGRQAQRASDLWSLGVTLFMAVEGRSPFHRGHALATLAAVMYEEAGPLHNAGPLAPVIEGLLVKDPARRMTAAYVAQHLYAVATGQVTDPVVPRPRQPPRLARLMPVFDTSPSAPVSAPTPVSFGEGTPTPVPVPAPVRGRRRPWALAAGSGALVALVGLVAGAIAFATARFPADPRGTAVVSTPTVTVFATRTAEPKTAEAAETGKRAGSRGAEKTATQPVANPGAAGGHRTEDRGGAAGRSAGRPPGKPGGGKHKDKPTGAASKGAGKPKGSPPAKRNDKGSAGKPGNGGGSAKPSQGAGGGQGKDEGREPTTDDTGDPGDPGDPGNLGDIPDGYTQPENDWAA